MSEPSPPEQKWELFARLLDTGVASLHIDARRLGVELPAHLRTQNWLVLNYSYRYAIADFSFDGEVVTASLSFGGRPYPCRVPWSAVFAVTNEARTIGLMWQADMPSDEAAADPDQAEAEPPAPIPVPAPRAAASATAPALRLVDSATDGAASTPGPSKGPRPVPHLRRVK